MNNIKKIIKNPFIVLIIAALIGGAIGSYLNYYFNNLLTENRNKEITKQLILFIHNEIYENYYFNLDTSNNYELLLSVEGLELLILRVGNLTIKDKQLSSLIKMYIDFSICNNKIKNWVGTTRDRDTEKYIFSDVREWRGICRQAIKDYEEEFCKDKSLKSEIEVE